MTRMTYSIDINRPIDEVFTALTDEKHLKEWVDGLVSITHLTQGKHSVGAKSRHIYHENGREIEMLEEILIFEPNEHVKIKGETDMFDMTADYRLTAIPTGTRIDFESTIHFHNFFTRLLSSFIGRMMRNKTNNDMHRLKESIEQIAVN